MKHTTKIWHDIRLKFRSLWNIQIYSIPFYPALPMSLREELRKTGIAQEYVHLDTYLRKITRGPLYCQRSLIWASFKSLSSSCKSETILQWSRVVNLPLWRTSKQTLLYKKNGMGDHCPLWKVKLSVQGLNGKWTLWIEDSQWMSICASSQSFSYNSQHKLLNRTYYTPECLHKIRRTYSEQCPRCKVETGSLMHMFWTFKCLKHHW